MIEEENSKPAGNEQHVTMTVDASMDYESLIEEIPVPSGETFDQASLFNEIINCVANSTAFFKSQHKNDPDLTVEEKAQIATEVFRKSQSMFLSRFGRYLELEHLHYFHDASQQDYALMFYLNKLQRYHNRTQRRLDVKNRRYQALKTLVEKTDYFSETEMMRRNPLLYDHLVGQYLTEEQKKARDNIDTQNITFVNLLLESIERDVTRSLKKEQQEAEEDVMEENDSDSDSDELDSPKDRSIKDNFWGEIPGSSSSNPYEKERNEKQADCLWHKISSKKRQILKDEFITNMYHSFLNGRDKDFDYSTVDDNESYDNVDLRTQDEEEKYFDSESPETISEQRMKEDESCEEDELDKYMNSLQVK